MFKQVALHNIVSNCIYLNCPYFTRFALLGSNVYPVSLVGSTFISDDFVGLNLMQVTDLGSVINDNFVSILAFHSKDLPVCKLASVLITNPGGLPIYIMEDDLLDMIGHELQNMVLVLNQRYYVGLATERVIVVQIQEMDSQMAKCDSTTFRIMGLDSSVTLVEKTMVIPASELTVTVKHITQNCARPREMIILNTALVQQEIESQLESTFFSDNQDQTFYVSGCKLECRLKVKNGKDHVRYILEDSDTVKVKVISDTSMLMLAIINKIDPAKLHFIVRSIKVDGSTPKEHVVLGNELNKWILTSFRDIKIIDGKRYDIYVDKYFFSVEVKIMGGLTGVYLMDGDGPVTVSSAADLLILLKDVVTVDKLRLSITKAEPKELLLVSVDDIVKALRSRTRYLLGQGLEIFYQGHILYLRVDSSLPDTKAMCFISDKTSIKIRSDSKKNLVYLTDNSGEGKKLKKVVIKLKIKKSGGDLISMMFGLGDGDDSKKNQVRLKSSKVKELVRKQLSQRVIDRYVWTAVLSGKKITLKVHEMVFVEDDHRVRSRKISRIGVLTDDTDIVFKLQTGEDQININDDGPLEMDIAEIKKSVGGIGKELEIIVRNLLLSKGKLKEEFELRGLKPTRGLLLTGPAGVGKTRLAMAMAKALGCTGDRLKMITGSDIFNRWLGESEARIRALFEPCKEAYKKLGPKAPLYVIMIDEIDAMLPARKTDETRYMKSIVDCFLACLDGFDSSPNLLIIGITNYKELLDEAACREGRFSVHVKIDLPNREGRKEIFDIHTATLRENGRLAELDMDRLQNIMNGYSGADIEGLVQRASAFSLERLANAAKIDAETIAKIGKVTMDDFIRSAEEKKSGKNEDKPPASMYL